MHCFRKNAIPHSLHSLKQGELQGVRNSPSNTGKNALNSGSGLLPVFLPQWGSRFLSQGVQGALFQPSTQFLVHDGSEEVFYVLRG